MRLLLHRLLLFPGLECTRHLGRRTLVRRGAAEVGVRI